MSLLKDRGSSLSQNSPRRKWLLRFCAFFLWPLLLFLLLEGSLRLAGYGHPTKFFIPCKVGDRKVLVQNERFGWRFFGPKAARTPKPQVLLPVKPEGVIRIFVFGESAAYGDPRP